MAQKSERASFMAAPWKPVFMVGMRRKVTPWVYSWMMVSAARLLSAQMPPMELTYMAIWAWLPSPRVRVVKKALLSAAEPVRAWEPNWE